MSAVSSSVIAGMCSLDSESVVAAAAAAEVVLAAAVFAAGVDSKVCGVMCVRQCVHI
jgi:hypothetical protein